MSSNVAQVRGLYDALARGDVSAVLGAFDPNIEWIEAEGFPNGGVYMGPDAVLNNILVPLASDWDGFRVAPAEFIDGGDQVVVLGRYSGTYKATGKAFEADFAHIWTLRDGTAVRFRQYVDSALVQEAMRDGA